MALGAPQQNLVSNVGKLCQQLSAMLSLIDEIDNLYSGTPNYDDLITDDENEGLPSIDSFKAAQITAADVATGVYIIKMVATQCRDIDAPAFWKMKQVA